VSAARNGTTDNASVTAAVNCALAIQEETARAAESFPEPMDAAELSREQGDAAFLVERSRDRLREIDEALAKMASGRYGFSERSGRPIGFDRLKVIPWARDAADEDLEASIEE